MISTIKNRIKYSKLISVIKNNDKAGVLEILQKGVPLNQPMITFQKETPMILAIRNQNKEILKLLIEFGFSVNEFDKNGSLPIQVASFFDSIEIAKILLNNGANPNLSKLNHASALKIAAFNNKINLLEIYIQNGGDINSLKDTSWFRLSPQVLNLWVKFSDSIPEEVLNFVKEEYS